jgi:hypothetical protein
MALAAQASPLLTAHARSGFTSPRSAKKIRRPNRACQVCKDSPLEGAGFEPSVPRNWDHGFRERRSIGRAPSTKETGGSNFSPFDPAAGLRARQGSPANESSEAIDMVERGGHSACHRRVILPTQERVEPNSRRARPFRRASKRRVEEVDQERVVEHPTRPGFGERARQPDQGTVRRYTRAAVPL